MTEPEFVRYEHDGKVGIITIDRPPVNAYDAVLHRQLQHAWLAAAKDEAVTAVVLLAAGKHFCAGADLEDYGGDEAAPSQDTMPVWDELEFIRTLMKPTIAAVQGGCIGGGQRFVFPCDLIFCSDDAFFCDPLITMGTGGIPAPLHVWLYGDRLAREMLFTGMRVPATRLHDIGTINRIYPRDELHAATLEFARDLSGTDPSALRQAKRAVLMTLDAMGQHAIRHQFADRLDDG